MWKTRADMLLLIILTEVSLTAVSGCGTGSGANKTADTKGIAGVAEPAGLEAKAVIRYPLCGNFLTNGTPAPSLYGPVRFEEKTGAKFDVYSLPGYRRNELGSTGWVGVVRRDEANQGTSKAFPSMGSGDVGCLLFLTYRDHVGDTVSVAGYLTVPGNPIPWKLPAVAICSHVTEIEDGRKPEILGEAGDCSTPAARLSVSLSLPDKPAVSVLLLDPSQRDSSGFRAALISNKAFRDGFTKSELDDLVRRYGDAGPWFPCSSSDCCRVF